MGDPTDRLGDADTTAEMIVDVLSDGDAVTANEGPREAVGKLLNGADNDGSTTRVDDAANNETDMDAEKVDGRTTLADPITDDAKEAELAPTLGKADDLAISGEDEAADRLDVGANDATDIEESPTVDDKEEE